MSGFNSRENNLPVFDLILQSFNFVSLFLSVSLPESESDVNLARSCKNLARLTTACKNLARLTSVLQDSCKINIQNLQDSYKINIQTPLKKSQKKRLKNLKDVKKSAK